jgi:hypothetical protein
MKYDIFEAWIEIEGARATEYQVTESEGEDGVPLVTAWIPSEVGKVGLCFAMDIRI